MPYVTYTVQVPLTLSNIEVGEIAKLTEDYKPGFLHYSTCKHMYSTFNYCVAADLLLCACTEHDLAACLHTTPLRVQFAEQQCLQGTNLLQKPPVRCTSLRLRLSFSGVM